MEDVLRDSFHLDYILNGFRYRRRLQFFFDSWGIRFVKLPEKSGDPDDRGESPFKQKDDNSHLCQDICLDYVKNFWFGAECNFLVSK